MSTYNENLCEYCNQPYYPERSTKKYCSDSCRQLAYLARRAHELSAASFVQEVNFERIPEPITDSSIAESPQIETPIEPEVICESEIDVPSPSHSNRKRRQRVSNNNNKQAGSQIEELLILGGIGVVGYLLGKYLNMPKPINSIEDPIIKPSTSIEFPDLKMKIGNDQNLNMPKTQAENTKVIEPMLKIEKIPDLQFNILGNVTKMNDS